ncbi:MAG TPA: AAA family ATPase [Solirubrobacterales bacterium]|nr:AAA family ATPase [Solirubrobacterales bacterium]
MAMAHPTLVLILTGPPGVGKTTAAALLAERWTPSVHLEADTFFRFIRFGYIEPWKPESHAQNSVVMGIVAEASASYAAAGYFTIVDGIVIPRWFLGTLRDGLHAAGLDAAYAVIRAPLPVCEARLREREGLPGDPAAIAQLWAEFADLGELEPHAVDVDGCSPAETAAAVARLLADGRLAV